MYKTVTVAVLLLIGIGIGFYAYSPKEERPQNPQGDPKVASEVKGITAIQTNPQTGEIEYRLQATRLTQSTSGQNILEEVSMTWTPTGAERYIMTATLATFDEQSGDFLFYDGFELQKQPDDNTPLQLVGKSLAGNTKTKQIKSDDPMQVTQGGHAFIAQAMRADLTTKDYEFSRIQAEFSPPTRNDTPLF